MVKGAIVVVVLVLIGLGGFKVHQAQQFRQNLAAAGYKDVKASGLVGNATSKATAPFHGCTIGFGTAPKGTRPRTIGGKRITAFTVSLVANKTGKWTALAIMTPLPSELGAFLAARHEHCP